MSDRQLLLLCLLGLLVPIAYYLPSREPSPVAQRLLVAVLSRLQHTAQRRAIRETWGSSADQLVFVLGEEACPLPKLWRLHPHSCQEWKLQVPGWLDDTNKFMLPMEDRTVQGGGSAYTGIAFTVHAFPVMVESLGVSIPLLRNLATLSNSSTILVELKDEETSSVLYKASFNQSDLKKTKRTEGYFYKLTENRLLPLENFRGLLTLQFSSPDLPTFPKRCAVTYTNDFGTPGLVKATGLLDMTTSSSLPFSRHACPLVSFQYSVLDPGTIKRLFNSKKQQIEMEKLANKDLRRRANLEDEEHGDMIFLPVIDSNETDCDKIKHFSKHAVETLNFKNMLLVNDDTFVDLGNVRQQLNNHRESNLWWSDFDSTPSHKWSLIPSFPVPKHLSMVISKELITYISRNTSYLRSLASLPAAIAIWFGGLDTKVVSNQHWSHRLPADISDLRRNDNRLAFHSVLPKHMKELWRKLKQLSTVKESFSNIEHS